MKQREQATSGYQLAAPHATSIPHELIPLLPANWPAEIPLARITTCGPTVSIAVLCQINPGTDTDGHPTLVYGPPDAALLEEKGASTALLLLAVLASQPHCSATKDWLSETLGHGNNDDDEDDLDGSPGLKRVDNVATQLRHLLFPPMLRDLPTANQLRRRLVISYRATRESGSGYRLAGLPLLWIDVEAIGEHLKQARALDQFGHDGLPAWQAAYNLAGRGIFLEREPYSDWASWRRQQVETQLWQSVQALWRPLAQLGEAGETEAVRILQNYWQNHMTNEDVLRPLIELLGKRECYGQAEEYYAHLCLALEQEDKQPDHRTQEAMTFLRALQIQREPSQYQAISQKTTIEHASITAKPTPTIAAETPSIHHPENDRTIKTTAFLGLDLLTGSNALLSVQSGEPHSVIEGLFNSRKELLGTPFLEFQQELSTRELSLKTPQSNNEGYRLSRRQVLLSIVALSMPLLATSQFSSHRDIEELLASLKMSIDACWQLSNEFDITAVYSVVSSCLPSLATIVKQSPSHRKVAAHLAAQASLLKAIIGRHINTLQLAEAACKDAILYSEIAEEPVLHLAALRHLAMIYYYAKCYKEELVLYQHMKPFLSLETIPPIMRSFIYAGWAGTQAMNNLRQEAQSSLALAHEMFSLQPTIEACPVYIDYDYSQLFISEGLIYYDLGSYQEALDAFLQVDGLSPKIPVAERGRLEFLNCQALAVLRLPNRDREMQQCIDYWTAGIQGAIRLKSKQRYDEICRTYEFMQFVWPHEKKIKVLREMMVQ